MNLCLILVLGHRYEACTLGFYRGVFLKKRRPKCTHGPLFCRDKFITIKSGSASASLEFAGGYFGYPCFSGVQSQHWFWWRRKFLIFRIPTSNQLFEKLLKCWIRNLVFSTNFSTERANRNTAALVILLILPNWRLYQALFRSPGNGQKLYSPFPWHRMWQHTMLCWVLAVNLPPGRRSGFLLGSMCFFLGGYGLRPRKPMTTQKILVCRCFSYTKESIKFHVSLQGV